jgi:hypothetical protein
MIRKHLAALAALAGLGLFSGCSSTTTTCCCASKGGLFSRLCGQSRTAPAAPVAAVAPGTAEAFQPYQAVPGGDSGCGCGGSAAPAFAAPGFEGPVIMDQGQFLTPGVTPTAPPALPTTPNLAPTPRLVPEPAQVRPYAP